jgi:hypothetical protein
LAERHQSPRPRPRSPKALRERAHEESVQGDNDEQREQTFDDCGFGTSADGASGGLRTGIALDGKQPVTGPVGPLQVGQGQALGGQQPVQGMTIQIYAVSYTGYGAASTPLLAPF